MICQIYPQIEGVALERFRRLSKDVMHLQRTGQLDRLDGLRDGELQRCQAEPGLNGCPEKYEACVRVLIDLAKLRWRIEEDRFGIELVAPRSNVVDPAQIAEYKETVRNELAPQLARQFAAKPVRTFIRQMEARSASSKRKPIQLLIADGRELRSRLLDASEARGAERVERLARAVQPYLQLVEPGAVDEFTNIHLGDIWRYCRYTWTLPQTNIPGRQLSYLVRDRAHPHHAIIGIAALSNAPLQMAERDDALGWSVNGFTNEVAAALAGPPATALPRLLDDLESNLARALNGIDATNLARPHEIADPTTELIARLRRRGDEFASVRAEILENFTVETPLIIQETEDLEYAMPPVSNDVLRLDQKISSDPKIGSVRRAMVAKKRAAELARLLQARIVFRKWRALFCDPATARATLEREEFSSAVNSALEAAKSARAGTNMLEITTCGAVKPYNAILGGKLVSLLMLSPEVASDYRRRYGAEPSIISSLIKNAPVCKDSRLVFLGTTSLYAHGPSQYNRLRLPRGVIASEQDEIRFEMLGHTGGFGTVHFPDETTRAIERVLEQEQGFRDVNSIFGEGRSPKLRKLRAGLKLLGFDPTAVLQHHQPRCIYGIRLCAGAGDFLLGKTDELPRYLEHPEEYREATARIAAFWRERWLASRLDHAPALETLQQTPAWRLSETIPVLDAPKAEIIAHARAEALSVTAAPLASAAEDIEFWRTLARAGKTVCSDELSVANLARLHVQTPLEDFLISKVREGFSLVLTGNAGDGKTHLMRRLAAELERAGADVEPDATAAMRHDSVAPILDRWRAALAANKPYCLAANEYPLYLLRRDGRPHLPLLEEVERQCRHRLAYGAPADIEDARDRVLVVDLSLRNPLGHSFAAAALEKVLAEPAVQQHAASNIDATFSWNYFHLANATVRARIISLFQRLVSRGHRSPSASCGSFSRGSFSALRTTASNRRSRRVPGIPSGFSRKMTGSSSTRYCAGWPIQPRAAIRNGTCGLRTPMAPCPPTG